MRRRHSDTIVIRDVVECEGERHAEWLLHYAGTIRSEGLVAVVENEGVSMTVTPFLPERRFGWRTSDIRRAGNWGSEPSGERWRLQVDGIDLTVVPEADVLAVEGGRQENGSVRKLRHFLPGIAPSAQCRWGRLPNGGVSCKSMPGRYAARGSPGS